MVLLWVVTNDARSLRKIVEKHSQHLNKIDITQNHRERVGHSICEILGGGAVGLIMGYLLSQIL
jgi:acid phosphatase family membrane protein YuiD